MCLGGYWEGMRQMSLCGQSIVSFFRVTLDRARDLKVTLLLL